MKLFKRIIRKIAPLAASALMLGSTIGFAAAADLATFPQPYVSSAGVADVAIVIGADAAAQDTIAATDIQSSLVVPTGAGTTTTVSGGEVKDIPLGYNLNDNNYGWSSAITDSDVPSLFDDNVHIAIGDVSDDYAVHEEVVFANGLAIRTGLNLTTPSDDYKDKPFLALDQKAITYRYVFDESVKKGNYLSNASTDEPVTLDILGKHVEITAADKTNGDDLTALVGDKFTLAEGESKDVGGKTVTLLQVGSDGSINVDVDGESKIVGSGNTKTIGGLRVKNHARIYSTATGAVGRATIIAGSKTSDTFNSGDEFIGEDEDDPDWIWQLSNLNGADDSGKPKINVTWDQVWTDSDEVLYEGDSLTLPGGYVTIKLDGLTEGVWRDFVIKSTSTELRNSTGGNDGGGEEWNTSSQKVLMIEALNSDQNGFKLPSSGVASSCAGKETDKIFLYGYKNNDNKGAHKANVSVYWWDHDNPGKSPKWCGTVGNSSANKMTVTVQHEDATFNLDIAIPAGNTFSNAKIEGQVRLVLGRGEQQYVNLTINTTANGFEYGFGTKDGNAQSGDVRVAGSMGPGYKDVGTWEDNTLTVDGLKIYDPDEWGDSNKFKFGIPRDENTDFRANVEVYGPGATTTTTGTQFTKAPSATFLDTQIDTVKDRNIISVGGSAVNRVSAKILGLTYPTYGGDQAWQDATGVTGEGQALIKVFDSPYTTGKVAMIVAGWTGVDTQRAGKAIYKRVPKLEGQEMLLSTVTETATKL